MSKRGENIRKRSDGRWEGRYTILTSSGKKYISVYAHTYVEVKDKLEKRKKALSLKQLQSDTGSIPFSVIAEEWLKSIASEKKLSTYDKYRRTYNLYIEKTFGSESANHITLEAIDNSIPANISQSLKKTIYCIINQVSLYGYLHYNIPYIRLSSRANTSKAVHKPIEVLSLSEQSRLIKVLYQHMDLNRLAVLLCLSTGIRLGELCALRWEDIDMEYGILYINRTVQRLKLHDGTGRTSLVESIPKTAHSRRKIPLSDAMVKLLKLYKNEYIYVLGKNIPTDPRTMQYRFKKYLKEADIEDKNFHILRHTFATNCIENGTDAKCVSELLGHSDVQITLNRYVHPSMNKKRQSINSLFSVLIGNSLGTVHP
jgi:integrase